MNQQEATKAGSLSVLRRRYCERDYELWKFQKKTVYDEKYWSSTNVLLLEDLLIHLWEQDKWLWGNSPGRHPGRAHQQGHQQADEVPVAGDEHFQNNCGKDGVWGWTRYLKISITSSSMDGNPANNNKRKQDWLKKSLKGGEEEGDLTFQLPSL